MLAFVYLYVHVLSSMFAPFSTLRHGVNWTMPRTDTSSCTAIQEADPDVMAHEVSRIISRINNEHEAELRLMCRHFLGAREIDQVTATSVDRLGIDLRVTAGELTDEYRIGFREKVSTTEDAKSELVKMFQEAWERENGYAWIEDLPPVIRYAEDILRK